MNAKLALAAVAALCAYTSTAVSGASDSFGPNQVADYTFVTSKFPLVPEDVSQVASFFSKGRLEIVRVRVAVCLDKRARHRPAEFELRVSGASHVSFKIGEFIATGAAQKLGKMFAAVRKLSDGEFRGLGCKR